MHKAIRTLAVTAACALALFSTPFARAESFNEAQTKAIEDIVRSYLLKHPELLLEVNEALQKQMQAKVAEQRKPILKSLYNSETPYSTGKGDVTVVEFFDYNCGYCRKAFSDLAQLIKTDKAVRVVFVDLAFFSELPVVKASLASAKQGKYFEFHSALMNQKGKIVEADALRVAKEIGLDMEQLKKDMSSPEIERQIAANAQLAHSMGVDATPAFFAGDHEIAGAPQGDELLKAVEDTRKQGCSLCGDDKKKS